MRKTNWMKGLGAPGTKFAIPDDCTLGIYYPARKHGGDAYRYWPYTFATITTVSVFPMTMLKSVVPGSGRFTVRAA